MFRDKGENLKEKEVETIIGPSVKVEGNFKGEGDVIIKGIVKGSLKTKKNLKVGEQAQVQANIEARSAKIAGVIQGNIKVVESLELSQTARVTGDIEAKILSVVAGAVINGKIKTGEETLAPLTGEQGKETSTKGVKTNNKRK